MPNINPRQFSSLDANGLAGSLTNRPSFGAPASTPIDLAIHFNIERQLRDYQKQNGTYVERSSAVEQALEQEQKAARDQAFRESVRQSKAAQEIQAQREQVQRTDKFSISWCKQVAKCHRAGWLGIFAKICWTTYSNPSEKIAPNVC